MGGLTRVVQDVPPYVIIEGHPARIRQINVVGLEREGFSREQLEDIKRAFKLLFRTDELNRHTALEEMEKQKDISPEVKYLITFLQNIDKGRFGRYRESFRYSALATY